MTPVEQLEDLLSKIDLKSLSDEDLSKFHALFSMKKAETSWIIRTKAYHKAHCPSKKEKANS